MLLEACNSALLVQSLVLGAVGLLSRGFMTILNRTDVRGQENFDSAFQRPKNQSLITVSNHTAALDDPLLLAAMMPLDSFSRPSEFRWGMCATDRCFKNGLLTKFFRAGKVLISNLTCNLDKIFVLQMYCPCCKCACVFKPPQDACAKKEQI